MAIRQAFVRWLIPAAFVLPLWLLIGFFVFGANAWGVFFLLLVAMPAVFIGQLVFSLLIRSRPSVQRDRAVSWQDLIVVGVWQVLTILVGTYSSWFGLTLTLAILGAFGVLWSCFAQLWSEARSSVTARTMGERLSGFVPPTPPPPPAADNVYIVNEKPTP